MFLLRHTRSCEILGGFENLHSKSLSGELDGCCQASVASTDNDEMMRRHDVICYKQ